MAVDFTSPHDGRTDSSEAAVNYESPNVRQNDLSDLAVNFGSPPDWQDETSNVAVNFTSPPLAVNRHRRAKQRDVTETASTYSSTAQQHAPATAADKRRNATRQAANSTSPPLAVNNKSPYDSQTVPGGKSPRRRKRYGTIPSLLATAPLACDANVGD